MYLAVCVTAEAAVPGRPELSLPKGKRVPLSLLVQNILFCWLHVLMSLTGKEAKQVSSQLFSQRTWDPAH